MPTLMSKVWYSQSLPTFVEFPKHRKLKVLAVVSWIIQAEYGVSGSRLETERCENKEFCYSLLCQTSVQ